MLRAYAVLLLLLAFVIVAGGVIIVLSHFAAPRRPTAIKGTPYESGMPPLGGARERFSVKFYLVAMLFIVFDIETVFLLPWAAIFTAPGRVASVSTGFLLVEMVVFLVILGVGYVYVWKRGALQWD